MLVHRRVTTGPQLYTWVERGAVTVKCPTQEPTQCSQPGVEPGPLERRRVR